MNLQDLHAALGGELRLISTSQAGQASQAGRVSNTHIQRIAPLHSAQAGDISFVSSGKHLPAALQSQASVLIASAAVAEQLLGRAPNLAALIITPDPYGYYARLSQWWAQRFALRRQPVGLGVSAQAFVDPTAQLAFDVSVAAGAFVGAGAQLGAGVVVGTGTVVEAGACIGANTYLAPRVVVGQDCVVGAGCIVHSGAVIGADGFGFAPQSGGGWQKIEQLGRVVVGDGVEIGANTCIDRGALGDTVIEDGVKLDNLIQIAHNVRIGKNTAIAACTGIAGSTTIGANCTIAGSANIIGHLTICDGVHISVATTIMKSITQPGAYTGVFPSDSHTAWEKNAAALRSLAELRQKVRSVLKKLGV